MTWHCRQNGSASILRVASLYSPGGQSGGIPFGVSSNRFWIESTVTGEGTMAISSPISSWLLRMIGYTVRAATGPPRLSMIERTFSVSRSAVIATSSGVSRSK